MLQATPLELAAGVVVGPQGPSFESMPSGAVRPAGPIEALRQAILPALRHPPCLVSFSGGLDSSFVLAVASGLARESGLPAPIPCTWRISGAPLADESAWQDRVVATLHLADWVKLRADDDLDLVGPVAQRVLQRHGVLHPVNAHLHLPIIELAAGGSVLTGAGGDQILSGWRQAAPARSLRDTVPNSIRALVRQRRGDDRFPWLHPRLSRRVLARLLDERGAEPQRFDRRAVWHTRRRDLAMTCSSLALMAAEHNVRLVNPFVDRAFVGALAETVGPHPTPARPHVLAAIAAGAVPPVIYERRAKARFLEVFLRAPTREFVSAWDGSGVDARLVNIPVLQDLWSRWPIPPATGGLVQQVWLSADREVARVEVRR